ncbi:MAG: class F420-dependent oxidoreductase [Jatrophihabitans sp.]|nr:class F420-dependent oxidoreductase [Jatrophihabitans sp.]
MATLTSLLPDGSLHVVPVGFTWDADSGLARVITSGPSRKARNLAAGGDAALSQFDGAQWLTLSGTGVVSDDPERVADAVRRYAERYREPRVNPLRVVIEITVTSILGSRGLFAD